MIVSGPAGVGKTTICDQLLKRPNFWRSISTTTRVARPGERDNVDYQFWNKIAFEKARDEGYFLEWAVYGDNLYGTPRGPVEEKLRQGKNVILNIEVQGAAAIRKLGHSVISFFLMPPSPEVLRQRIMGRNSDSKEEIERRLRVAEKEMARAHEYDYRITNTDIGTTVSEIEAILEQTAPTSDGVET